MEIKVRFFLQFVIFNTAITVLRDKKKAPGPLNNEDSVTKETVTSMEVRFLFLLVLPKILQLGT